MLVELRLENYAVIDNLAVEFAPGLNLLTGETGAGKSILIDALALLLGEKASANVIRSGADKAIDFRRLRSRERSGKDSRSNPRKQRHRPGRRIRHLASRNCRRRQGPRFRQQPACDGGGVCASWRRTSPRFTPRTNRCCLSTRPRACACSIPLPIFRSKRSRKHSPNGKNINSRIEELQRDEQDRLRLLDLWTFQAREIEEAKLQPGEDERLETEKRVLANAEKIYSAAMNAFDLLYEGNASTSASLRAAQKHIEELARYEPKFQEAMAALETARISVEDVGASLRDYAGGIEASPEHLAEVEDRLAAHRPTEAQIWSHPRRCIHHGAEVSRKLSEMENKDEVLRQLRGELEHAAEAVPRCSPHHFEEALRSRAQTGKAGRGGDQRSGHEVQFPIEVSGTDEEGNWTAAGFDQVSYMIATNPGEPLAAAGTHRLRRGAVPRHAGAQGERGGRHPARSAVPGRSAPWSLTKSTPESAAARQRRSARN